jgi:predicted transcriptional regulator
VYVQRRVRRQRCIRRSSSGFHTLTPLRWNIIRTMMGAGALTLREVARRVERDLAAVQWDLHALLDAGVLERTGVGAIVFPYDAVHVDFALKAA